MNIKIISRFLKSILLMLSILNFNINYSMTKTNRLDDIKTKVMKNIEEKLKELGLENIPSSNHLNLILNLLFYQKCIINTLKFLEPISHKLIDHSSQDIKITAYIFQTLKTVSAKHEEEFKDKGIKVLRTEEDVEEAKALVDLSNVETVILETPEQISSLFKCLTERDVLDSDLIKEQLNNYYYWNNLYNLNRDSTIKAIMNNEIHRYSKIILYRLLSKSLFLNYGYINIIANFYYYLTVTNGSIKEKELEDILNDEESAVKNGTFAEFIERILDKIDIKDQIKNAIPDFVTLLTEFNKLSRLMKHLIIKTEFQGHKPFDINTSIYINNSIKRLITLFEVNQKNYEKLYENVMSLKDNIIKYCDNKTKSDFDSSYTAIRFSPGTPDKKSKILPSSIEDNNEEFKQIFNHFLNIKINTQSETQANNVTLQENWLDFLTKKSKSKGNIQKQKKKKKSRRRPHKKQNEESEKELEDSTSNTQEVNKFNIEDLYFEIPKYASRILEWFDKDSVKDKNYYSVLYHTYCPIVDLIIKKYGKVKLRINRTTNNQDKAYYLLGLVKYPNGNVQSAVFVNCYDKNGTLYHRGIETNNSQEIYQQLANKDISFNIPLSNITQNLKRRRFIFKEDYEKIYRDTSFEENELCIYVKDNQNNTTLILFK